MASVEPESGDNPPPFAGRERSVSSEGESLYSMLNVEKNATDEEIRKSYRKLALKHHPDKNPDNLESATAKIKELNDAYGVLKDPTRRKIYDKWGTYGLEASKKFGEDFVLKTMALDNWCFKLTIGFLCLITGCCFCFCLCGCCCCCGGKCCNPQDVDPEEFPMEDLDAEHADSSEPITTEPGVSSPTTTTTAIAPEPITTQPV